MEDDIYIIHWIGWSEQKGRLQWVFSIEPELPKNSQCKSAGVGDWGTAMRRRGISRQTVCSRAGNKTWVLYFRVNICS